MNKKILILANNSGGLYGFRKELMQELISQGYSVYASTPFDDFIDELKEMGITLIKTDINRRGMNPIKDLRLIVEYAKIIKQVKPRLIISYTIKPNLYGASVARILKIPYAINITGLGTAFQKEGLLKKMVVNWYKFVCKRVKVVFFENIGNRNLFIRLKIVDEKKCCVLNGAGVNTKQYYFSEYPEIKDKIHFLFIGRIMKEKGVEELFWCVEELFKENKRVVLDVVGSFEDNYEEKIHRLEAKGCLHYYGYQKDVRPFIERCHCFILPSYHEGMANTLLEAASMGRPLITSDIHGCKEIVINGENGYIAKVKNSRDLFNKMKDFIDSSMVEKENMGIVSRRIVESKFKKEIVISETLKSLKRYL